MKPFDQVVAEHGVIVWQVCRAVLDPADADDAWSETFLAAMRGYPNLRPDSNVRAWLVTIAHSKAIDQTRRIDRAPRPMERAAETPSTDGNPEPVDEDLRAALEKLPPKQRQAVIYHHIAGLSYAEVGALIDSSEAAARRSSADGIANLRRSYVRGTKR